MFQNSGENGKCCIVKLKGVTQLTGISRSCLYDKLNVRSPRHDPQFPKPIKLGPSAVGWLEHELMQWIESRANNR